MRSSSADERIWRASGPFWSVRATTKALGAFHSHLTTNILIATAELETALRAKEEFLSRAGHDLRTPMNHVLGFAQLLERDELSHQPRESVQQILTSGRHLLQLIDRIPAVSKSQSNDLNFLETPATHIGREWKRTDV